jgi:probable transcriptional regulator
MTAQSSAGHQFREHINTFPLWETLTDEEKDLLAAHTQHVRYPKGMIVHRGGLARVATMHIISGSLRAYLLSEEGRELTLYFVRTGDITIVSSTCALETLTGDIYIDANEDTAAFVSDTAVVRRILKENVGAHLKAYETTVTRLSATLWKFQQMLFTSADRRLAKFLIDESERTAGDDVNFTHEQTAHYLGTAREVVSRLIREYGHEGLVQASRGHIRILDRAALQKRAGV